MKKPKVIILTTPLGNGHNAVANAVAEQFNLNGALCVIIDLYEYVSPALKEFISKFHVFYMKSFSKIKDIATNLYDSNEKRDLSIEYSLSQLKNKLLASKLDQFISEFQPDIIICTQVYAAQVINILKEEGKINSITVGIITDYTVQVYWEHTQNIDYIVVADEQLKYQLKNRNIADERVLATGIPILEKFSRKRTKYEAKKLLGIHTRFPAVLIIGGGMGFGKMAEYLEEINSSDIILQLLIVCGNNDKLVEKLSNIPMKKKINIYGFVDNIDIMMDACECIISKAGGITVAEALAKELPIIVADQLPGIEDRNLDYLMNNGAALYSTKSFPLNEALNLIFTAKNRVKNMKQAMRTIAKPHASSDLYNFLQTKVTD